MESYKFLLLDDEKDVCEVFIENAIEIGIDKNIEIQITDCQYVDDFFRLIQNDYFHAVILDAKGKMNKEQQVEDTGVLQIALERLKEFEQKQDRHIPFAINTGQFGEREREIMARLIEERRGKIFDKKKPKEELINFLVDEIRKTEETKIEKQYKDVLEAAELHLPSKPKDFRAGLLKVLKEFENPANNESVLSKARVIQDEIYKSLRRKGCFSEGFNPEKRSPSFVEKNKHLSGNEQWREPTTTVYQTPALSYLATSVFKTCSSFGNHLTSKPTNVDVAYWELPSNYAVKSVVYALLEQLIWFKKLMDK